MNIDDFYFEENGFIFFDRPRSSLFAKNVAGDFNPIHDIDARRFCVPGDLLFSVVLHQYGLANSMSFQFLNMVDSDVRLKQALSDRQITLSDGAGKDYMVVDRNGSVTESAAVITSLVSAYVQFSGQTFPYLLVDLMENTGLMINRTRPLVFYRSMELQVDRLDASDIRLEFTGSTMQPEGKKADVSLNFDIVDGAETIGTGSKKMVLGGLREYHQPDIDVLVSDYQEIKNSYVAAQ